MKIQLFPGLYLALFLFVGWFPGSGLCQDIQPVFTGKDSSRKKIAIRLVPALRGLRDVTDIQFVPDMPGTALVLQQSGRITWNSLADSPPGAAGRGVVLDLPVSSFSELGLLGLAFHPDFKSNRKIYLNYTPRNGGSRRTRVSEWQLVRENSGLKARNEKVILEVAQPYSNHNAGQLAFGPDGLLYVGLGDGGSAADPQNNAQNPQVLLGKMLRIDVNRASNGRNYAIPSDNPFVNQSAYRPEIWALGLRNPWRYSFDPSGRLIVADVGQNAWEEIDIVSKGGNYGWNRMEGAHCFPPDTQCDRTGLSLPVVEHSRDEAQSITGGYVYAGKKVPALKGLYVYGDFSSGHIWAARLPEAQRLLASGEIVALGKWPLSISTFGRDLDGEIYVGDYSSGTLYRIESAPAPARENGLE